MALPVLSLQPGWLRKKYALSNPSDARVVLDRMQALGITGIEGGAPDPVSFKRELDARGLRYSGTHTALSSRPDPGTLFSYLHAVGGADICNSGILEWNKPGPEHFREGIRAINELARAARVEGIYVHYHNHAFEFDVIDGTRTGMDYLLDGLDFANDHLGLCLDIAWVWRGGQDPARFIEAHAEKIRYLHLKDTDDSEWQELGRGKIDWQAVFRAIEKLPHCRWAAIEQDETREEDPLVSVEISRKFLREQHGY
jgi:sugar phosphate isomerase/epimerase